MPYSASQVATLQAERTNDPHTRGYSGMDDAAFLTSVNLADISVLRNDITTQEIFEQYVGADLPLRNSDEWEDLMLLVSHNNGAQLSLGPATNLFLVLDNVFNGTTTATNLASIQNRDDSPAKIAGLPPPSLGDVQRTS